MLHVDRVEGQRWTQWRCAISHNKRITEGYPSAISKFGYIKGNDFSSKLGLHPDLWSTKPAPESRINGARTQRVFEALRDEKLDCYVLHDHQGPPPFQKLESYRRHFISTLLLNRSQELPNGIDCPSQTDFNGPYLPALRVPGKSNPPWMHWFLWCQLQCSCVCARLFSFSETCLS